MNHTRRAVLGLGVGAATGALAGCLGSAESGDSDGGTETPAAAVPTADAPNHLAHDRSYLREKVVSGGPGKDGIPSVDDPTFIAAADVDFLDDDDVVFGVARGETVKAYPQPILVHHEIVNDRVDGRPVSVTYCPLTGTTQGFVRGDTTFGVSGNLVNNNLVMYDRATDSRWPQVLATAIEGAHEGDSLREFGIAWTTWGQWRSLHPETQVLSRETGHVRNYGRDPYGSYGPKRGYYNQERTMFPRLEIDDRLGAKDIVFGVRTDAGATAITAPELRDRGLLDTTLGGERIVVVHDDRLDAGYGYRPPAGADVGVTSDGVVADGETFAPDALPFERVPAIHAMWFAWSGFYPDTELHGHA